MTSIHHNTTRHPRIHLPVRRSLEIAVTAATAAGIAVAATVALTSGASQPPPAAAAAPPSAVVAEQGGFEELERVGVERATAALVAASQNTQVVATEIERFEVEAGGSPSLSDATTGQTFEELERYVAERATAAQLAAGQNAQVIAVEIERFEAESGSRAPLVDTADDQTRFEELERYMASR
jgi:hypothetical protein